MLASDFARLASVQWLAGHVRAAVAVKTAGASCSTQVAVLPGQLTHYRRGVRTESVTWQKSAYNGGRICYFGGSTKYHRRREEYVIRSTGIGSAASGAISCTP